MNFFSGVGRLAKDVNYSVSQSNVAIANTTIAIQRPFTNAQGQREADFINCVAFRKTAELLSQYFQKGKQIGVNGRIQTRSYEDKNGNRQFVTELVIEQITFINDGSQNSQNQGTQTQNNNQGNNYPNNQNNAPQGGYGQNQQNGNNEPNPFSNSSGTVEVTDDQLPF